MKNRFFLILLSITSFPVYAQYQAWIFGNLGYGHVEGFSQTPKGGSFGTTTLKRPTLREMNIQHNSNNSMGMGLSFNQHFLELCYQPLSVDADTFLKDDLITHAKFLSQNTPLAIKIKYDWYSIKYGKDFYLKNKRWILSPSLQGDWVKYHYHFQGIFQSSRAFTLGTLSAGLKIQHHIFSTFWIEASGQQSLFINQVKLSQAALSINYPLQYVCFKLIPKIGIGYLRIAYKDKQPVPNYIQYVANPYGFVGLTMLIDKKFCNGGLAKGTRNHNILTRENLRPNKLNLAGKY